MEHAHQAGVFEGLAERRRLITALVQSTAVASAAPPAPATPESIPVASLISLLCHANEFIRIAALQRLKVDLSALADTNTLACNFFDDHGVSSLLACAIRVGVREESSLAFKIFTILAATARDAHLLLEWRVPEACVSAMLGRCNNRILQHVNVCVSMLSRSFFDSFRFAATPEVLVEVADVCPQSAAHIALTTTRGVEALVASGKLALVILNTRDDTLSCELADACVATPGGCVAVRGAVRKLLGTDAEQGVAALATLVWNDTELALHVVANHEVAVVEALGRAITRGSAELSIAFVDLMQALLESADYASPMVANFCAAWLRMTPESSDLRDALSSYLEAVSGYPNCARAVFEAFGSTEALVAFSDGTHPYLLSKVLENADWELHAPSLEGVVSRLTFEEYADIYLLSVVVGNVQLAHLAQPQVLERLLEKAADLSDIPTFVVVTQVLGAYRAHNPEGFKARWDKHGSELTDVAAFLGHEARAALSSAVEDISAGGQPG